MRSLRNILTGIVVFLAISPLRADENIPFADPAEEAAFKWLLETRGPNSSVTRDEKSRKVKVVPPESESRRVTMTFTFTPEGSVIGLDANAADFTNDELPRLLAFKNLETLILYHNGSQARGDDREWFSGTGLEAFQNSKLTKILFAGCPFSNAGMAAAAKLPHLKEILVYHSRVTDEGVALFEDSKTLEKITLGPVFTPEITNRSLQSLAKIPTLNTINISETWLTYEDGLRHLLPLRGTLKVLNLGSSLVDPADIQRLQGEMPELTIKHEGVEAIGEKLNRKNFERNRIVKWADPEILDLYRIER